METAMNFIIVHFEKTSELFILQDRPLPELFEILFKKSIFKWYDEFKDSNSTIECYIKTFKDTSKLILRDIYSDEDYNSDFPYLYNDNSNFKQTIKYTLAPTENSFNVIESEIVVCH